MIQGEKLQYFLMNYDICEYKPIKNGALYWTTCSYMSDVTDLRDIFKRGVALKRKHRTFSVQTGAPNLVTHQIMKQNFFENIQNLK